MDFFIVRTTLYTPLIGAIECSKGSHMSSHENESHWRWTDGRYASLPPKELARVLPLALANLSAISRDSLAVIQPIARYEMRSPGA